jgi:hypothetical protein
MRGNKMGKMSELHIDLMALSGETYIPVELLAENEELLQMIVEKKSHEEILDFINENW